MTSPFIFTGGDARLFKQILTTTNPTPITFGKVGGGIVQYSGNVVWLRCNEYAGGVANLTVELYDVANTTSYYLGSGGFTWITKALTAKQSVLFDDGIPIPTGFQLRVTASIINNVMVEGVYVGRGAPDQWSPKAGA